MCVCIFFHREGFFRLQDVQGILEGTDQQSCVVIISWVLSAKFHYFRIWKCHISPPKTKTLADSLLERKRYDIMVLREKMIYIDIGYKSAHHKLKATTMMMIIMMMICFCGMVDRRKAFSLISSWDHCQTSLPSRISDTPRAGFERAQNLSSGLVKSSGAVVIWN